MFKTAKNVISRKKIFLIYLISRVFLSGLFLYFLARCCESFSMSSNDIILRPQNLIRPTTTAFIHGGTQFLLGFLRYSNFVMASVFTHTKIYCCYNNSYIFHAMIYISKVQLASIHHSWG